MSPDYRTYTDEALKREYALCKQEVEHHKGGLQAEQHDLKAILGEAIRRKLYISHEAEDDTDELIPHEERFGYYEDDFLVKNAELLRSHIRDALEELLSSFHDLDLYENELEKRGLLKERMPRPFLCKVEVDG